MGGQKVERRNSEKFMHPPAQLYKMIKYTALDRNGLLGTYSKPAMQKSFEGNKSQTKQMISYSPMIRQAKWPETSKYIS